MRHLPLILALLLAACSRGPDTEGAAPKRAFYLWRTTAKLTDGERAAIERLHVNRLFLRLFDVDTPRDAPEPVGKVSLEGAAFPAGVEVVPVVFLRERVFRSPGVEGLAPKVWKQVRALANEGGFAVRELELDCDWTDATREAYFAFLRELGALAGAGGTRLGATIRLHQVKFRERTGVPPVERGMLMFYNMGRIEPGPEPHAIFDAASASAYLARLPEYPLPLDVALPIWSWTRLEREGRVEDLLQSTDAVELEKAEFLVPTGPGRFRATRTTFLHGTLVREDDVLQAEAISPEEALAAARLVAPRLPPAAGRTTTLFDLSERNLARHDPDTLERLFSSIR